MIRFGICNNEEEISLYQSILRKFGSASQSTITIEEMSELSQALCKLKRFEEGFRVGNTYSMDSIKTEMVHVLIAIEMLGIDLEIPQEEVMYIKRKRLEKLSLLV
jgi:NTP pyrophosphatase (non-canonical NTP hydrolase)